MKSLLTALFLASNVRYLNADCAGNCTECTTLETCIGSAATDGCAYSSTGGCVARSDTPFSIVPTLATCATAESACTTENAAWTLASILSEQENEWALSICAVDGSGGSKDDCYIGLGRSASETVFSWSDGSAVTDGFGNAPFQTVVETPSGPWQVSEPKDADLDDTTEGRCVLIDDAKDYLLEGAHGGGWRVRDESSTNTDYVLCRTTAAPTQPATTGTGTTQSTAGGTVATSTTKMYGDDDDDDDDSSSSSESSESGSSSEGTIFGALFSGSNGDDVGAEKNEDATTYTLELHLSEMSLINLWCLVAAFLILNGAVYYFCFYRKTGKKEVSFNGGSEV